MSWRLTRGQEEGDCDARQRSKNSMTTRISVSAVIFWRERKAVLNEPTKRGLHVEPCSTYSKGPLPRKVAVECEAASRMQLTNEYSTCPLLALTAFSTPYPPLPPLRCTSSSADRVASRPQPLHTAVMRRANRCPQGARSGVRFVPRLPPVLQGLPGSADAPRGALAVQLRPTRPRLLPAEPGEVHRPAPSALYRVALMFYKSPSSC